MNTEQEVRLLPCPFCGWKEPKIVTNKHANMSWVACADCGLETPSETGTSAEDAAEYWNRRAIDEQAEVVARPEYWALHTKNGVHIGLWKDEQTALKVSLEYTIAGCVITPLYAYPPAVAAGGVTEERVEAVARFLCAEVIGVAWDGLGPGSIVDKGYKPFIYSEWATRRFQGGQDDVRNLARAALAVGDEGIREGWQDIAQSPPGADVDEILGYQATDGDWCGKRAICHRWPPRLENSSWMSSGGLIATHWQPLPAPPSRGEGV